MIDRGAMRLVRAQVIVAVVAIAFVFWAKGLNSGLSALLVALACVIPNVAFAWWLARSDRRLQKRHALGLLAVDNMSAHYVRNVLVGEFLKVLAVVVFLVMIGRSHPMFDWKTAIVVLVVVLKLPALWFCFRQA